MAMTEEAYEDIMGYYHSYNKVLAQQEERSKKHRRDIWRTGIIFISLIAGTILFEFLSL